MKVSGPTTVVMSYPHSMGSLSEEARQWLKERDVDPWCIARDHPKLAQCVKELGDEAAMIERQSLEVVNVPEETTAEIEKAEIPSPIFTFYAERLVDSETGDAIWSPVQVNDEEESVTG